MCNVLHSKESFQSAAWTQQVRIFSFIKGQSVPWNSSIIIIIIIKNEKIRVTLCENTAVALYIVNNSQMQRDHTNITM